MQDKSLLCTNVMIVKSHLTGSLIKVYKSSNMEMGYIQEYMQTLREVGAIKC